MLVFLEYSTVVSIKIHSYNFVWKCFLLKIKAFWRFLLVHQKLTLPTPNLDLYSWILSRLRALMRDKHDKKETTFSFLSRKQMKSSIRRCGINYLKVGGSCSAIIFLVISAYFSTFLTNNSVDDVCSKSPSSDISSLDRPDDLIFYFKLYRKLSILKNFWLIIAVSLTNSKNDWKSQLAFCCKWLL